jgi:hypothetical protein
MDKNLTIKEKILYFIENQYIKKEDFYKITGISASNFKGLGLKSEIGGEKIVKILTCYPILNPEWLLTGNGSMLKQKSGSEKPEPPPPDHHYLIDLVEYQKKHIASLEKEVSQLKKEYTTGETLRMVSEPIEQLKK